ncbi:AAA family ATPase [Nocardioides sp.]|uniref:helix-turn-helix transcriptional regulator n=1 Tax=Nocardioides sp. TaxID=35761 RepID=UPI0031FF2C85|nr:putative LuxR-family transcriptional regulator [Nocardioides sp.]
MALFARASELDVINALLGRPGAGGALVLRGEAGVGKSALLDAAISNARRSDVRVLTTAGVSLQMQQPFAALSHLTLPLLGGRRLTDHDQETREVIRAALTGEDAPADRPFSVAYAVLELLAACAAERRLLVVVDDASWVDEESWRILSFVGRRVSFDEIGLVFAMRDGPEAEDRLRGSLLPTVRVEPLPDEAAVALLHHVAPGLRPSIRDLILAEAGGNPLGLLELSDEVKRHGDSVMLEASVPLPARLVQTYAGLVSELPDATGSLLMMAAFNDGHSLQETLDATALAFEGEVTLEDLEPAVSARLVSVDDRFELRFRHPLVGSAMRQITSLADHRRAHLAFADLLRDDPDRSVAHQAAAAVGKDDELARALASAARRARRRGALTAVVTTLERSAQLTIDESSAASRLLWAALSAAEIGDVATVERLVNKASQARLTMSARARLAWLQQTYLQAPWSGSIQLRTLLDVVDQMRNAGDLGLALDSLVVMSIRAWWSSADPETRDLIVAMAQTLDESLTDARAVYVISVVAPLEHGSWALDRLTELAGAGEANPERLHLLASTATCLGAVALSNVLHAEAVAGMRRRGRLGTLTRVLAGQAWAAVLMGDARVALTASSEARALGEETGYLSYALVADLSRAAALALRGETAAADGVVAGLESVLPSAGRDALLPMLQLARGLSALAAGRPDDAFDQLLRSFQPGVACHPSQKLAMLSHLAEAASKSGQLARLEPILADLAPVAATTRSPSLLMSVRYAEALLAQADDGGETLRVVLEADLSGWPFDRARLQLAYGTALRHRRQRRESRPHLRAAAEGFEALGARRWAEWAWHELRASGETVQRVEDASANLSPQELQIAMMAAQGRTNREIAAQLFISPRTVSTHLYRIYPKVGISTRAELHRVLADQFTDPQLRR